MYYTINEEMARRAKDMNSFFEYVPGSATRSYQAMVDEAVRIGEERKQKLGEEYYEQIDHLVDLYARKLADNLNKGYEIETRCPSIMVAGGSNFPVRKKEKQNAARDRNYQEYNEVQGILERIRKLGTGGIRSDDKNAVEKLEAKVSVLEKEQEKMKAVNAYYRKHKTLDGCEILTDIQIEELKAGMSRSWRKDPKPYESFELTNNNANIHRIRERIESLKKEAARHEEGQESEKEYDGFTLKENVEAGRIQFLFDGKPEESVREILKSNGFRWAPSEKAWQRMLNENGRRAARQVIERITA